MKKGKPYVVEGTFPGTVNGCVDQNGNFVNINTEGPAGDWCRKFASGGAHASNGNNPSATPSHGCNCHGASKGMRNFMGIDAASITKNPVNAGFIGLSALVAGHLGCMASKKVKIPVIGKNATANKWIWILALGAAGAYGANVLVNKYNS